MVLSVMAEMEDAGVVVVVQQQQQRKGVVLEDESGAPESWEMVDLEENMKKLLASSQVSQASAQVEPSCESNGGGGVLPFRADSSLEGARGPDQVDGFLKEALQNPRDRLTILRLEQEVERFIRNPSLQVLEFQPMPSSYLRLAAHRVAQHYYLQSMVVDGGSAEGTRIVARKTGETRFPSLRLVDIPVAPVAGEQEEKAVMVPVVPTKVAIKQRPSKGGRNNGLGPGGNGGKLNPSKSVEERKEEYNKARARIFCNELTGKGGEDESESENGFSVASFVPDAPRRQESLKEESILTERELHPKSASVSPPKRSSVSPPSDIKSKEDKEKDLPTRGKLVSSNSLGSNGNGGSRVAIFRDREKDRRDPDYDRSTARYAQRFDPGFGVSMGPYGGQALYAPVVNYNTEFPQLGVPSRGQLHMEPPPPQSLAPQHLRAPWVPPVNAMGYRASESMMGPYNPAQMAPMAMYMRAPQYAYPGHAMNYMQHPDQFQQSQPHSQQQPDASVNQARRR
ncbi:hypothetical protein M758_7G008200 [Ceratodon purpureus]|uniref:R3H domain-containing protein 2 n=1 Tax=Ceratodon purpureus TaxID=3225 RepID=A0A8T0H9E0_CERPU|nr:hypothetical protein KC19_7G008800 [Ceratodon purpureus]KAG0609709.1 hypothetical protein M758_7G008200 [Ceratodon purpureus]